MLLFLRHSRCVFCKETILDIMENYRKLLQPNTIPILVHMETPDFFTNFLKEFDNQVIMNLLRVHDENNFASTVFGIHENYRKRDFAKVIARHVSLRLSAGLTNSLITAEGVSRKRMPALFIIENETIVHEFRHLHFGEKPDYLRVLIDPELEGKGSDISTVSPHKL
jgi:hypothetical protein